MKPDDIPAVSTLLPATATAEERRCAKHLRAYTATQMFGRWTGCPDCLAEQEAEQKRRDAAAFEAMRRDALERAQVQAIGRAGIPERFLDRSLDTFIAELPEQQRALAFARAFAERPRPGQSAIFCGRPGTGKTHLACGIALAWMARGESAVFVTVARLLRRIKATWARGSDESEAQAIEAFARPALLIVDEVGVQFGSEAERNLLFDVLNERYEARRSTILLSNLPAVQPDGGQGESVASFVGERVLDRFREDGGRVIPFGWESHRRRSGA